MVEVHFIESTGNTISVDAKIGLSVMEVACENMVPEILGDCGGSCSCATCHVIVDEKWFGIVGGPSEDELGLLEFSEGVQPRSRLSCQIQVSETLNGLTLHLPPPQRF